MFLVYSHRKPDIQCPPSQTYMHDIKKYILLYFEKKNIISMFSI